MQDFIAKAADRFGLSEDRVSALTGGLLAKVKDATDADTFGQIAAKVPGLQGLVAAAGESGGGGGGLLGGGGGLLGGLASAAGMGGGDLMGLISKSGLDLSKASGFVQSLVDYLKAKAGDGLVGDALAKVPGLAKFLG